ncbi:cell wall hydrolase [Metabacillus halosaccharovorans]|uniref:cell wall hydrolase n=1 Tax=Metabacillus halosaccharovorans TaxID=930124 RepID=UPI001C1FC266|nr:cell wall hydrolase [Metabacillus halosaccharovorans]MBU7592474.1 LysM peptidoglycan-binding domain-containing protein [Metabacillus halosaccharovorans]
MKKLIFLLTLLFTLLSAEPIFAYTVQKGDTMSKIARDNGMSLSELASVNPQVNNLDLIYVGQEISIDKDKKSRPAVASRGETISSKVNISEADIDLLARIVRAEAQSEPFEGKVAVASVVLNRVDSPKFPDTIRDVIYQSGQFQPVSNGEINKPADKESRRAVFAALSDMRKIAKDSLFFYNPDIATNRWLDSRETIVVIGQHVFKN